MRIVLAEQAEIDYKGLSHMISNHGYQGVFTIAKEDQKMAISAWIMKEIVPSPERYCQDVSADFIMLELGGSCELIDGEAKSPWYTHYLTISLSIPIPSELENLKKEERIEIVSNTIEDILARAVLNQGK